MARRRSVVAAATAVVALLGGCAADDPEDAATLEVTVTMGPTRSGTPTVQPAPTLQPGPTVRPTVRPEPGAAPTLGAASVTVGDRVFAVEVADAPHTRSQGLSGRDVLEPGTGMLFAFETAAEHTFWMPDMAFALDIAWISGGEVIGVDTMTPCTEADPARCRRWPSPGPVDAALEVPAGELDGVTPGARVDVSNDDVSNDEVSGDGPAGEEPHEPVG